MQCVFVQIRCKPGKTYDVAREIYLREIVSELYSTSGDFDLLAKIYIPAEKDIGVFINEGLLGIPNIDRSLTTITFKAIHSDGA
jgi:DNA-binding Lrp family transcriptional regulator